MRTLNRPFETEPRRCQQTPEKIYALADNRTRPCQRAQSTSTLVRNIGLTLPGVEARTVYGSPALHRLAESCWRACLLIVRLNRVRLPFASVSTTAPNCLQLYYVTDHYLNYSPVLVCLSRLTPDVLKDLLGMVHKFVTADMARPSPPRNRCRACLTPALEPAPRRSSRSCNSISACSLELLSLNFGNPPCRTPLASTCGNTSLPRIFGNSPPFSRRF